MEKNNIELYFEKMNEDIMKNKISFENFKNYYNNLINALKNKSLKNPLSFLNSLLSAEVEILNDQGIENIYIYMHNNLALLKLYFEHNTDLTISPEKLEQFFNNYISTFFKRLDGENTAIGVRFEQFIEFYNMFRFADELETYNNFKMTTINLDDVARTLSKIFVSTHGIVQRDAKVYEIKDELTRRIVRRK